MIYYIFESSDNLFLPYFSRLCLKCQKHKRLSESSYSKYIHIMPTTFTGKLVNTGKKINKKIPENINNCTIKEGWTDVNVAPCSD